MPFLFRPLYLGAVVWSIVTDCQVSLNALVCLVSHLGTLDLLSMLRVNLMQDGISHVQGDASI